MVTQCIQHHNLIIEYAVYLDRILTNVWQRFSTLRTFGNYSDLYVKTEVLLLADVFENFCDSCVASYGLDSAYYYLTGLHETLC